MTPSAALATLAEPAVIVESKLFGPLTVSEDEIFRLGAGLFGFPECRSWILLSAEREGVYWLQSVEHAALAFVLLDPFTYFDGYSLALGAADRADLAVTNSSDVAILAIVTLPGNPDHVPTANLRGPLALNMQARVGKQLALDGAEYDVRAPVDFGATTPAG